MQSVLNPNQLVAILTTFAFSTGIVSVLLGTALKIVLGQSPSLKPVVQDGADLLQWAVAQGVHFAEAKGLQTPMSGAVKLEEAANFVLDICSKAGITPNGNTVTKLWVLTELAKVKPLIYPDAKKAVAK
jgi:hypothetical protein